MLTKDMLKFRRSGEYIKPFAISCIDEEYLKLAAELLSIYSISGYKTPPSRGEIATLAEPLINDAIDIKVAKGLQKLILDHCDFAIMRRIDYPELRKAIFATSAAMINLEDTQSLESYQQSIHESLPDCAELFNAGIYSDLPENEILQRVIQIFPKELLQRYNCAQVQSLLFHSQKLILELSDAEPSELRRTFKYLKFFRLLAEIYQDSNNKIKVIISGPATILENTQKYGLQLATFFPAVCLLKKWSLKADVKINDKILKLNLNQDSQLVSHYHNFSAYVPEEFAIFHRLFKEKNNDWQIVGETPFFKAANQEIIFPDLSFKHYSGQVLHLELFHRWHYGALIKRLEYCADNPDTQLLLGIDKILAKNTAILKILENQKYFSMKGFVFNDFPSLDRVRKLLDSNLNMMN
jgi:predicted nuclease of restriction endonuclease-like RecB superfamily